GRRRANAVKECLVGFGLDPSRFETQSFGESRPLDPRSNEEAWAKNRRAEFRITGGGDKLVLPRTSQWSEGEMGPSGAATAAWVMARRTGEWRALQAGL